MLNAFSFCREVHPFQKGKTEFTEIGLYLKMLFKKIVLFSEFLAAQQARAFCLILFPCF